MTDAEKLKTTRKALDLNQTEMAEKMGYGSKQAISRVETGRKGLSGPARKLLDYIKAGIG